MTTNSQVTHSHSYTFKVRSFLSSSAEAIRLLIYGKSYDAIAQALGLSVETVRTHIKKMYRALEVINKAEAIAKWNRGGRCR